MSVNRWNGVLYQNVGLFAPRPEVSSKVWSLKLNGPVAYNMHIIRVICILILTSLLHFCSHLLVPLMMACNGNRYGFWVSRQVQLTVSAKFNTSAKSRTPDTYCLERTYVVYRWECALERLFWSMLGDTSWAWPKEPKLYLWFAEWCRNTTHAIIIDQQIIIFSQSSLDIPFYWIILSWPKFNSKWFSGFQVSSYILHCLYLCFTKAYSWKWGTNSAIRRTLQSI